jgi:hypothetical protein
MAQKVGAGLGQCEVLFRSVQAGEESGMISPIAHPILK